MANLGRTDMVLFSYTVVTIQLRVMLSTADTCMSSCRLLFESGILSKIYGSNHVIVPATASSPQCQPQECGVSSSVTWDQM